MLTIVQRTNWLFRYVREHGTLINQAKTEYGFDKWVLRDMMATLGDGGYTITIWYKGREMVCLSNDNIVDFWPGDARTGNGCIVVCNLTKQLGLK